MPIVDTVRGPVDLSALGRTLMHEHVFVMQPEPVQAFGRMFGGGYWDEDERVADAIAKLRRLREGGITTIVDPTAFGLGRNIERVQRINAEVDLNINDFMVDNPFFADERPDYLFISNEVIPRLGEAGVTSEAVVQMMEENPRTFFSG